jgi:hypothetical protein
VEEGVLAVKLLYEFILLSEEPSNGFLVVFAVHVHLYFSSCTGIHFPLWTYLLAFVSISLHLFDWGSSVWINEWVRLQIQGSDVKALDVQAIDESNCDFHTSLDAVSGNLGLHERRMAYKVT